MSVLLHEAKLSNQILPQEKRKNATILALYRTKLTKSKCFQNVMFSQTFYPNLQIFLHGYIPHIRDIL